MSEEQGLATVQDVQLMPVTQMKAQLKALHELMKEILKKDVDYGTIPGTSKPTLYKPGAEKICTQFSLDPQYEVVESVMDEDFIVYDIRCVLYSRKTGLRLGSGLGSCNSREEKYRWRKSIHKDEFDAESPERRREKLRIKRDGTTWREQQVMTNPYDLANTIEKMASKRALIAGVLNVTNASEVFTQDLEDMPKEYTGGGNEEGSEDAPAKDTSKMLRLIHVLLGKLEVPKDEKSTHEYVSIKMEQLTGKKHDIKSLKSLSFEDCRVLIDSLQDDISKKGT